MNQTATDLPAQGELTSPVGQYEPEMLVLAPATGEDGFVLSLVAQLLEIGVAVELTDEWRLPTEPTRELSAYKTCLMPDTAAARHDADLDAFVRAGGWLPYFKYYPTAGSQSVQGVHHFLHSYGRDSYFYHAANVALESGVHVAHPEFVDTMRRRRTASMLTEHRQRCVDRYASQAGPWRSWGDPQYTQFLVNMRLSRHLEDEPWMAITDQCIERLYQTVPQYFDDPIAFQEIKLPGVIQNQAVLMGSVLMEQGLAKEDPRYIEAGVQLVRFYVEHCRLHDDVIEQEYLTLLWSESLAMLPAFVGLQRFAGDEEPLRRAMNLLRRTDERNRDAQTGLWHHWSSEDGRVGAYWSRGTMWAVLWMTEALRMMDPARRQHDADAAWMVDRLARTYESLARVQDEATGLWRLVLDQPMTRVESSATAGLIYCHDRLREMGLIDDTHDTMVDRAFVGMKQLWYAAGTASNCRGTATGLASYYASRPQGHYTHSLYPAAFATRLASA
ncbi:MAG: glycoside hydrolase family 88 protein [bacterium]